MAGSLSGGQRKLLEMARALMTDPKVVMLDEPMAGVNPALTQSLLEHVKSLRDEGMTVVFVEHDMDVIRDISDWVVVMAQGTVIAESTPETLADNEAVVDAYLGSHHDQALEFDDDGNPVGATAVLAEEIEQAVAEAIEAGGDLSQPIDSGGHHRGHASRMSEPATESTQLTPAERAATPDEHQRLAEGALVRADHLVAGTSPRSTSCAAATSTCATARSWASSVPTAPGSRHCSRRCSGSSRSGRHGDAAGDDITSRRRTYWSPRASGTCRRTERVPLVDDRGEPGDGHLSCAPKKFARAVRLRQRAVPAARVSAARSRRGHFRVASVRWWRWAGRR